MWDLRYYLGVSLPPSISEGRPGLVARRFQAICPSPSSVSTSESAKGCEKLIDCNSQGFKVKNTKQLVLLM